MKECAEQTLVTPTVKVMSGEQHFSQFGFGRQVDLMLGGKQLPGLTKFASVKQDFSWCLVGWNVQTSSFGENQYFNDPTQGTWVAFDVHTRKRAAKLSDALTNVHGPPQPHPPCEH